MSDADRAKAAERETAVPISSPRCDAWRPTVADEPYPITPATETRCSFAAGHPMPHARHGITWIDDDATGDPA